MKEIKKIIAQSIKWTIKWCWQVCKQDLYFNTVRCHKSWYVLVCLETWCKQCLLYRDDLKMVWSKLFNKASTSLMLVTIIIGFAGYCFLTCQDTCTLLAISVDCHIMYTITCWLRYDGAMLILHLRSPECGPQLAYWCFCIATIFRHRIHRWLKRILQRMWICIIKYLGKCLFCLSQVLARSISSITIKLSLLIYIHLKQHHLNIFCKR